MLLLADAGDLRVSVGVGGFVRGLAGRRGFFVSGVLRVVSGLIICPIGIVTCMI